MTGGEVFHEVFRTVDLPALRLAYADGVIVCRRVTRSTGRSTGSPLGRGADASRGDHDDDEIDWIDFVPVTTNDAVRVSMRLATQPDLDAVVVHERFVPAYRTALAVAFATRLHRARVACGECPDVVATASRPDLSASPDQIGVPHLVTVAELSEPGLVDRVVWEVMRPEVFLCWLPDMAGARRAAEIERRLPGLLRMRGMIREGGLARLPFADELEAVLCGGELTIRAVFAEPDLFFAAADYLYDVLGGEGTGDTIS